MTERNSTLAPVDKCPKYAHGRHVMIVHHTNHHRRDCACGASTLYRDPVCGKEMCRNPHYASVGTDPV